MWTIYVFLRKRAQLLRRSFYKDVMHMKLLPFVLSYLKISSVLSCAWCVLRKVGGRARKHGNLLHKKTQFFIFGLKKFTSLWPRRWEWQRHVAFRRK